MKPDRQIDAARGLVAGSESLGVLIFVNEGFASLRRPAALAALDRLQRSYMQNTNVIVYFHDSCTAERNLQEDSDGSQVQIHRVSALGDSLHRLSCVFLKELKQVVQMVFRPEHFSLPVGGGPLAGSGARRARRTGARVARAERPPATGV